ncbi:hypothetical protein WR25_22816 [Diploscapter pachys]|uniref:Uncharacterized protein n=1 Tax=Diploscapter pachys TaxID=2018661 RepID=A0A2A2JJQ1_9BILA|nr:hypothetical protein WR25_22816 [Diploscapter pachys]
MEVGLPYVTLIGNAIVITISHRKRKSVNTSVGHIGENNQIWCRNRRYKQKAIILNAFTISALMAAASTGSLITYTFSEGVVNRLGGSIISPYHILTVAHGFLKMTMSSFGGEAPCSAIVYRKISEIRESRIVAYGGRCIRGHTTYLPNHKECKKADVKYAKLPVDADDILCATSTNTRDYFAPRTCHGDSGAGMEQRDSEGRATLVAITSFGTRGCPANMLGRFTKVVNYLDTICEITGVCKNEEASGSQSECAWDQQGQGRDSVEVQLFFIVFGLVYFLESIGGFYMTSAVVYIEKQFQIPSRLSGTMVSAGDFAYIPLVIFTSYFGGKGNRARWIGVGSMLIAVANFLIASSNFLFPVEKFHINESYIPNTLSYEVDRYLRDNVTDLRLKEQWFATMIRAVDKRNAINGSYIGSEEDDLYLKYQYYCNYFKERMPVCKEIESRIAQEFPITAIEISSREDTSMGPFMMIFCGLLVLGVGRTMPFSLGLPLIDDNVKKNNLPLYFAMMFFCKILGPVLGLLIGAQLNKVYYNFNPPPGLSPIDPMWIGCWWLGFLVFGALLFFPSLGLALFPSDSFDAGNAPEDEELVQQNGTGAPAKKKSKGRLNLVDRHIKKDESGKGYMPETFGEKVYEFASTVKNLFKNPIFVGAMCGRIVDVLAFKGFFVFIGKYLEIQFGFPQFQIQRYLAGTGIGGFACGVMIGSISMKKFRLQGRKAATWVACCSLMAALLSFTNGLVGCKSVIGTIADQGMRNNYTYTSCRQDCKCDAMPMYPVCNREGQVFYSPCQAGCPITGANFSIFSEDKKQEQLTFTDCFCSNSTYSDVSRKYCKIEKCEKNFKWFFVFQSIGAVFGGLSVVPGMLIVLRAVPPEHRSISLGFNGFLVSLLDIWVIYWAKGLKLLDDEEKVDEKTDDSMPMSSRGQAIDIYDAIAEIPANLTEEMPKGVLEKYLEIGHMMLNTSLSKRDRLKEFETKIKEAVKMFPEHANLTDEGLDSVMGMFSMMFATIMDFTDWTQKRLNETDIRPTLRDAIYQLKDLFLSTKFFYANKEARLKMTHEILDKLTPEDKKQFDDLTKEIQERAENNGLKLSMNGDISISQMQNGKFEGEVTGEPEIVPENNETDEANDSDDD